MHGLCCSFSLPAIPRQSSWEASGKLGGATSAGRYPRVRSHSMMLRWTVLVREVNGPPSAAIPVGARWPANAGLTGYVAIEDGLMPAQLNGATDSGVDGASGQAPAPRNTKAPEVALSVPACHLFARTRGPRSACALRAPRAFASSASSHPGRGPLTTFHETFRTRSISRTLTNV